MTTQPRMLARVPMLEYTSASCKRNRHVVIEPLS